MTNQEFSNEFDVLVQSYLREGGFTLSDSSLMAFDEYEKSMFLTYAQEQYVLSLYNGKNSSGDMFEGTEEIRRYLHNLVAEYFTKKRMESDEITYAEQRYRKMDTHAGSFKSALFKLPADLWFITYESVQTAADDTKPTCDGGVSIVQDVIPVTQDEFHKIKRNPFRGPSNRRALRLDLPDTVNSDGVKQGVVEIISKYDVASYYARYVKKPDPIILINLPSPLQINGVSTESECKLHEAVHRNILELAVRMAISSRSSGAVSKKEKDKNED